MRKRLRKPIKKEKDFSDKILKILAQNPNKGFNYKQIGATLELDDTQSRLQNMPRSRPVSCSTFSLMFHFLRCCVDDESFG